jgi:hypothetical protein
MGGVCGRVGRAGEWMKEADTGDVATGKEEDVVGGLWSAPSGGRWFKEEAQVRAVLKVA